MNSKIILCLALVLGGGLLGCSTEAQRSAKAGQWEGFPILPPIANANPAIRQPVLVHVPSKLKIERTSDTLSVAIDTNSFEPTNLLAGLNMVVGYKTGLDIYPEEKPPTSKSGNGSMGGEFYAAYIWHRQQDGIPLPGKKYVVEVELEIFETDIPPQHMWSPGSSKNYRVLWQRTLKQTVK
jgi:hypothetical protein